MKVSFVIPSRDCVTWLPHAVTSCLEQTHKDVEVVIVDDGSRDLTGQYLASLRGEARVRVLMSEDSLGRSGARNWGNRVAQGEVLCVLDADDIAVSKRAELMARKLGGYAQFAYGSAIAIDPVGVGLHEIRAEPFNRARAHETLLNHIVHSTVAYTREFAERFPYPEAGDLCRLGLDDWAQQTAAAHAGVGLECVPGILANYRLRERGTVATRDEAAVEAAKRAFLATLGQAVAA